MLNLGYIKSMLRLYYGCVKSKILRLGEIGVIDRLTVRYARAKTWWRAGKLRAASCQALNARLTLEASWASCELNVKFL